MNGLQTTDSSSRAPVSPASVLSAVASSEACALSRSCGTSSLASPRGPASVDVSFGPVPGKGAPALPQPGAIQVPRVKASAPAEVLRIDIGQDSDGYWRSAHPLYWPSYLASPKMSSTSVLVVLAVVSNSTRALSVPPSPLTGEIPTTR